MNDDDPYRSPQADLQPPIGALPRPSAARGVADGISTDNTIMPRYFAASVDDILAIVLSLLAARSMGEAFADPASCGAARHVSRIFLLLRRLRIADARKIHRRAGRRSNRWPTLHVVAGFHPHYASRFRSKSNFFRRPARGAVHRVFEASPAIRRQARPDHCRSARPGRAPPRLRD